MRRKELIGCGVIIILSLLFMAGAADITPREELTITSPGAYPMVIAALCLLCALWVTWDFIKKRIPTCTREFPLLTKDVAIFVGLMALYYVAMLDLHYTLSTLAFTFFAIWFLARSGWKTSLLVAYIGTFMILLIFKHILSVIMP